MPSMFYTAAGTALPLGRRIAGGGEGEVFEVPGRPKQVAKIYLKEPDANRQAKLLYMTAKADPALVEYIAWPQETLHTRPHGPVVGFLMPSCGGMDEIHEVYSAAHRRHNYPDRRWDFLVHVARNIAACFESVHSHGHVIGDVNERSVFVGRDSRVKLIDSDSFQLTAANGTVYRCEVGVPLYTPPELQSGSFRGLVRTANHDAFGMALLIFQVLLGGRHPYAGVPLLTGTGDDFGDDIRHFRYAYARDGVTRGVKPPPRSIPIAILPDAVEAMFQLAFTERGALAARPSAREWVTALDALRGRLKRCGTSAAHIYPNHLARCPWCALEHEGVVYFIDLATVVAPTASGGFVLARVWALIQAVPAPPAPIAPRPVDFAVTPQPLPPGVPEASTNTIFKCIVVVIAIGIFAAAPNAWLLGVLALVIGWPMASNAGAAPRAAETTRRRTAVETARQDYERALARVCAEAGPDGFNARKTQLSKLKEEWEGLPAAERKELDHVHATAHQRQLKLFLERCFIDTAEIEGIKAGRKAKLRSFGIETAADLSRNRIMQVRGFGVGLTDNLMDWRAACERRFRFDPAKAVTAADRAAIATRFAARRIAIEHELTAAPAQLHQFRNRAADQLAQLKPQLDTAARQLAQAQSDLALMG